MIKPDIITRHTSEEDLKMTETPKKMRDDNKNIQTPSPGVKRSKMMMNNSPHSRLMKNSPLRSRSQSYSCLHQHSPSQITARKLLRKYNSNLVKMSGQR